MSLVVFPAETRRALEESARAHGHQPGAAQFERRTGQNVIRCANTCGRLVIVEMALSGRILSAGGHLDDCDGVGARGQEPGEARS